MSMVPCAREECARQFEASPKYPARRYCSKRCQTVDYNRRNYARPTGLSSATVGAMGELIAAADLLRCGYEVFRAVSPACSCDLVAFRNGILLRVEVRTGKRNATTGALSYSHRLDERERLDHYCIVSAEGDLVYVPPLPD